MLVCVQGLGFVGSAMAIAIADCTDEQGLPIFQVCGVELDTELGRQRAHTLGEGNFPFKSTDLELERAARLAWGRGNLSATVDPQIYSKADIIVVDVHCDIDFRNEEPTIEFDVITKAIEEIGRRAKPGCLILIETTVPPGTCTQVLIPILQECYAKRGIDISELCVAHSYERVMPGENYYSSIKNFWRVFAANNDVAAKKCRDFLSLIVNTKDYPLTELPSITASETAKVLENSYRAANIAFITEWTEFCDAVGINLTKIIDAIRLRPTHSNIMYPGLGVGGYCLTKDPAFVSAAAKELYNLDLSFPFSQLAMRRNEMMPHYVVKRVMAAMRDDIFEKNILLCGASYRKNVGDTRFSPSEVVFTELNRRGANIDVLDPHVEYWSELDIVPLTKLSLQKYYDFVLLAVPHDEFREMDLVGHLIKSKPEFVLDGFSFLNDQEKTVLVETGIKVFAIGEGDF